MIRLVFALIAALPVVPSALHASHVCSTSRTRSGFGADIRRPRPAQRGVAATRSCPAPPLSDEQRYPHDLPREPRAATRCRGHASANPPSRDPAHAGRFCPRVRLLSRPSLRVLSRCRSRDPVAHRRPTASSDRFCCPKIADRVRKPACSYRDRHSIRHYVDGHLPGSCWVVCGGIVCGASIYILFHHLIYPVSLVLWYMPVCTATDALRRHSRVLDLAGIGAGNSRLSRRGTPRAMAGTAAAVRTGTKATIAATQFTEKPQSDRPRLYTPSLSTRGRTSMTSGRKDARSAAVSSSKLPKKRVYLRSKPELATRSRTPNRRLRRTGAGSRSLLWWWWWCRRCGRHGGRVGAK